MTRTVIHLGGVDHERICLYLFGGVVLLTWTMNLICQYWWVVVVAGVIAAIVVGVRWYLRRW